MGHCTSDVEQYGQVAQHHRYGQSGEDCGVLVDGCRRERDVVLYAVKIDEGTLPRAGLLHGLEVD